MQRRDGDGNGLMSRSAERKLILGETLNPGSPMPVPARLSVSLHNSLGDDAGADMVEWMRSTETQREIAELQVQRFEARMDALRHEVRADIAELKQHVHADFVGVQRQLDAHSAELAAIRGYLTAMASAMGSAMGQMRSAMGQMRSAIGATATKAEMAAGFDSVNERFVAIDKRFVAIDERFVAIDEQFVAIDTRFVAIDKRFVAIDEQFAALDQKFPTRENLKVVVAELKTYQLKWAVGFWVATMLGIWGMLGSRG